jgi:hypothetical protein
MNTIDLIIRDACECEVPAKHDTDTVELRVSDLRMILERNLSAVPAVPDALNLAGDAGLAHDQCRAVVHMALALAEVHVARALIIASGKVPTATERIGESSAALMEYLGDALSNMDAVEEEDDAWLDPIFEAAHARWPVPEAEKATPEGCTSASSDVLTERRRQVEAEGYDADGDDEQDQGEMARAAAAYLLLAAGVRSELAEMHWPWEYALFKRADPRRMLVKAAALAMAEIERLDRAAALESKPKE